MSLVKMVLNLTLLKSRQSNNFEDQKVKKIYKDSLE